MVETNNKRKEDEVVMAGSRASCKKARILRHGSNAQVLPPVLNAQQHPVVVVHTEDETYRSINRTWTKEEDASLVQLVESYSLLGFDKVSWSKIARKLGSTRSGKAYRERWMHHLRPGLVKGNWTQQEDALLKILHGQHGNM